LTKNFRMLVDICFDRPRLKAKTLATQHSLLNAVTYNDKLSAVNGKSLIAIAERTRCRLGSLESP